MAPQRGGAEAGGGAMTFPILRNYRTDPNTDDGATGNAGRGTMNQPEVTRRGALGMQVCVPFNWSDEQVVAFAERENPCGTTAGWQIRREGHRLLNGAPERAACAERPDFVHVMLDA